MRRFYAPANSISSEGVTLGSDEARHLRDVLRLRPGDGVSIFDGSGREYLGSIVKIDRKSAFVTIEKETAPASRESPFGLILAAGVLKGDKFDLVVQKSVELGVKRLIPLETARCDVKITNGARRSDRWRRICLEATKQSGRALLMSVDDVTAFDGLIKTCEPYSTVLFSERGGRPLRSAEPLQSLTAIVGPEGGWDDAELASAASADIPIITLGGRILRAETAAIAISAILQNRFGDLN